MQQPSRRQFVAASLAGLPMLAQSGAAAPAGPFQRPNQASASQRSNAARDPVLEAAGVNLRELVAEGEARPSARKEAARGIEATLGIVAVHVGAYYDAHIQREIRRREASIGRAALVDEIVRFAHAHKKQGFTHDLVETGLDRLSKHGIAGSLRDLQRAIRGARLHAPDAIQAATLGPAQFDFCADLRWMIDITEIMLGIACALAFSPAFPLLEPICAALGLYLASLKLMQLWWC